MSFSFNVRGKSATIALLRAKEEMAKIVQQQPAHALDSEDVMESCARFVGKLSTPGEGQEINLSVNGFIVINGDDDIRQVSHAVYASIMQELHHHPV